MPKSYRFPKNPLCIYCQTRPGRTVDHVFACSFFGSGRPAFSMKVPSCAECNKGKGDGAERDMSNDEEYVRTLLAAAGGSHPTAARLIEDEIARSLARNSSLRNKFKSKLVRVDAVMESGIVVPNLAALELDADDHSRIERVLGKMVKGLCYTMSEVTWPDPCPLPLDWRVVVQHLDSDTFIKLNQRFDGCSRSGKWTGTDGLNAIRFRGVSEARDSHRMLWLLLFYDVVPFFAYTEPAGQKRDEESGQGATSEQG